MSTGTLTVEVPDIGDFEDVPIIEILVSAGDTVAVEDPLVTLESDKATMDVPAPSAGVVREIAVKVGDRVSQGTALMTLEEGDDGGGDGAASEPGEPEPRRPSLRPPRPSLRPPRPSLRPATAGGRSMPAPRPAGSPVSSASS